ncbi:hypothetical protein COZ61_00895 [Candidatus Berkelbacteria bacterium CG_4_8_14_3_um_filter_33_6]|uniref:Histidine kinase/HSP90-like ATPase domain-containing protein n=1 Tax=Candidatus Berkelbacteria bacterium CG_4_10_14_0_2_um_filter_35_9_33_12 TaxID=1974499 RepID=A0A2M7W3H7_9BACT|nr:MAG: hypothetical protein COX10_00640 [Candidatus Berkelbacteria bacterium CG23_combo_of_CG06-09_8_20_14_all_33_15]PIX31221.1 MAG: hypothetical protein COZ61_00895 [Candidatus Berkelbacteria bacterium CG_4_8_14_3_um_filter_33_6]PIZ27938.1 MAG: hypothetical protein COY43_03280 [Candidatus Berkelbacteria bacterium CG_4_10_14_0_8_um_filter_35_9_33_8]PJA20015.1 MAG: hypothetical protein COX60_03045 [Candidatus Berkelbacteria bacterium CG_4_10_14_0_2_um_filter_35_9_33_12]
MENNTIKAKRWLNTISGENILSKQEHCPTRDIFQARLDKIRLNFESKPEINLDILYSLIAIIGEIGNNAYDHNLGKWRDMMGIYFDVDFENKTIVVADRGQGILSSIQKVKPETKNDLEALKVAFTEVISGRYPEKRGNGLKFVTKVSKDLGIQINLHSGNAVAKIENKKLSFENSDQTINGVLAIIKY